MFRYKDVCVRVCVCVCARVCACVLPLKSATRYRRSYTKGLTKSRENFLYLLALTVVFYLFFCMFVYLHVCSLPSYWASITTFCFTLHLKLHHLLSSKQRYSFLNNDFIRYLVPFLLRWQSHIDDSTQPYKAFLKQTNPSVNLRQSVDRIGLFLRLKVAFNDYIKSITVGRRRQGRHTSYHISFPSLRVLLCEGSVHI